MTETIATVSVDVDPLHLHLEGYGAPDARRDDLVYEVAIPRLISIFSARGVRATFFFVAGDAAQSKAGARAVRSVVDAGHEAASHSVTHSIPFRTLPADALEGEIRESKRIIESLAGDAVTGFRAPNWDLSAGQLGPLAAAGYRYDASAYPSPFLCAARMAVALGGGGLRTLIQLKFLPMTWRRAPFSMDTSHGRIVEFPIATTRLARFPLYHTTLATADAARMKRRLRRGGDLSHFSYAMHAIDVLTRSEVAHPALQRHPTVLDSAENQQSRLAAVFAEIGTGRRFLPFRDAMQAGAGSTSAHRA
jgi:peptidoglycan/xylan/chitin deacetylase (PgdA/CDA1 family)